MKITKKQLVEMVRSSVAALVKENAESSSVEAPKEHSQEVESQLEDAVSILEMISHRVMNFPVQDQKAVSLLPKLIENLEKLNGFLGKFVNLQEMSFWRKSSAPRPEESTSMAMRNLLRVKTDLMSVADELDRSNSVEGARQAIAALKSVNTLITTIKKGN